MTFEEMLAEDMAATVLHTDKGAESVTYTTAAGVATVVPAFFVPEEDDLAGLEDGTTRTHRARCGISTQEANGITDPSDNDTVTVDGTVWQIDDIHEDKVSAILNLVRYETVEKSGPDHRLRRP